MLQWRLQAECRGTTSEIFFPDPKLAIDERYYLERIAIKICEACAVYDECQAYAVENPNLVRLGIWGGKTYKQIRKLRKKEWSE